MKAFEIKSQTDQTPFALCSLHPTQRELTEAQDLLDDPDHRLDRAFACPVDRLAQGCLELVRHFHLRACIIGWRIG